MLDCAVCSQQECNEKICKEILETLDDIEIDESIDTLIEELWKA